jgi:hypothetical protein
MRMKTIVPCTDDAMRRRNIYLKAAHTILAESQSL